MTATATREAAPWIERLARVGYAAKAVLYATIGVLAASAALSGGGRTTDTRGAMGTVLAAPFGRVLLMVVGAGLFGYALWRMVEAINDPENRGSDAKGIALRFSFAARSLAHAALGFTAFGIAAAGRPDSEAPDGPELWTARALEMPGGRGIVLAVAAGIIGYALYQLYRAAAAKLSKKLELHTLSPSAQRLVIATSRFGIGARGLVFGMIGVLMLRAARQDSAEKAGGIGDALKALSDLGKWPFAVIAIGLIAYGGYELLNARFRRIRVD
ncbi:MAG TPA: DUF1206 domain-containing protein [Gemmatimonadaceae bacterium]|nr:DUF1206 domain-containing protein [Gemmatimonadaceae bacterium]